MKQIRAIIQEAVNTYREHLIVGNYKVVKLEKNIAHIIIDGDYKAELWISDIPEHHFGLWAINLLRVMHSEMQFKTEQERLYAWKVYKLKEKQYKETKEKRDKQKQINRLRKELEELEAEQRK